MLCMFVQPNVCTMVPNMDTLLDAVTWPSLPLLARILKLSGSLDKALRIWHPYRNCNKSWLNQLFCAHSQFQQLMPKKFTLADKYFITIKCLYSYQNFIAWGSVQSSGIGIDRAWHPFIEQLTLVQKFWLITASLYVFDLVPYIFLFLWLATKA